jgi:cytidine deaminase
MKGNIMDKKILLGGAAALLLVGNMYATPANAAIDLSIGGEAKLTAGMSECGPAQVTTKTFGEIIEAISGATNTAAENTAAVNAITGTDDHDAVDADDDDVFKNAAQPCAGADRSGIDWGFGKEITIDASGTLANGLEVSFSDKIDLTNVDKEEGSFDMTLGGAFGSLQFKDGAPSAVDAAMVTGKKDLDVTGPNIGFHSTETAGSAGMGVLWTAPSMGNLDLYVSWAPNSGGNGLDTAKFDNTFAFGAVMNTSGVTIGAGYEAASANAGKGGECVAIQTAELTSDGTGMASDLVNSIYGGDYCGDETLMYIGATMDAADIAFSAGYSVLDTEEADKTVMSIGASTTVSAYDVSIDYRQTTKDYERGNIEDTQSVVALGLGTSLGDGVDLGLSFSTSDVSEAAQAVVGDTNYYFAEASLTVGF